MQVRDIINYATLILFLYGDQTDSLENIPILYSIETKNSNPKVKKISENKIFLERDETIYRKLPTVVCKY